MNDRFLIRDTPLPGVKVVERLPLSDIRGFLERVYCSSAFCEAGFVKPILQINRSVTLRRGALRGLHFQRPPRAECKAVSCLRGAVFDVAVDLRPGSPTFLAWHGEELSADNRRTAIIPEGFAHGLQTLTDDCEMLYLHTEVHSPEWEGGFHAQDSTLAIIWPLNILEMSERDRNLPGVPPGYEGLGL